MSSFPFDAAFSRRRFLAAGGGSLLATALPGWAKGANHDALSPDYVLKAASHRQQLLPDQWPQTSLWSYSGGSPGPVLRARQGERLRVMLQNHLEEPTTVHWHGLRVENAMDGVPGVTQAPVEPGEQFLYDLNLPDAGTYWYHPHVNSTEQVARGLHGVLIVEERDPPKVDREALWVLDDWRLDQDGGVRDDFQMGMDISHGGRFGNYITVNGREPKPLKVRGNERIRLRLVNVANARIFALQFEGHAPQVIAMDGHPVPPHAPQYNMLLLAPGQRVDVMLDCTQTPGTRHRIMDVAYPGEESLLQEVVYGDEAPVREAPLSPFEGLAANPLAEPDLDSAIPLDVVISGGAMGTLEGAQYKGRYLTIDELVRERRIWALNGVAAHTTNMAPMHVLERGKSYRLHVQNNTRFAHPMHLHGHAFRVLSRDGVPVAHSPWSDTVLLSAQGTAELALVADNPGDWLFHCHVLSHVDGGMLSLLRVA